MSDTTPPTTPPPADVSGTARSNRKPYSRAAHRDKAHQDAHAQDGVPAEPARIPDHPLIPRGPGELIIDDGALAELIVHLRAEKLFAYDSEFIGELTYHPKLCVIQVASPKRVALIDPLAEIDLTPFWELLADGSVEKVVHAGGQDLEPVVRHLNRPAANVFDTQIAAGMAAMPYPVALAKLTLELTGVKLPKGLTFTHWDQRPLSNQQLRYAADDVRYLPFLRDEIGKRLESLGHADWATEECAVQCEPSQFRFDPETQFLRVRGSGSLDRKGLTILRALFLWRDQCARDEDVPPRAFLRDEVLLDMARQPVKTVEALNRVKHLPRPVEARYGKQIVELTLNALAHPAADIRMPKEYEPSPTEKFRGDALWAAAQSICAARGLDPAIVLSRQDLTDFFIAIKNGEDAPADHKLMKGWRYQALGRPLLELYRGKKGFSFAWSEGRLRTE